MAEIAKADDWGLEARAFDLPQLAPGETSLAALAGAEIKLALAVLKYARHARGGRLDPAQLSRNFDHKPTLARSQGRAGSRGRKRDARQLSARPPSQARAVRAPAPGAAEGPRHRQPAGGESRDHRASAGWPDAQGRHEAPECRAAAPAPQAGSAARRGGCLRPGGAGRRQSLPAEEQHSADRHAHQPHAIGAQWR